MAETVKIHEITYSPTSEGNTTLANSDYALISAIKELTNAINALRMAQNG